MIRWRKFCLVSCLLLLGACSGTTFVYNRLDFVLPWYVDDYVELNSQQEIYLDGLLSPFLIWHRSQELPVYIEIIGSIESRLDQPSTPEGVAETFAHFEAAWFRLEGEALDWLLELGAQLSDEQIEGFLEVLSEQQEEYREEYLERTQEEFYEDNYDNLVDNAREYLGSLSKEQREQQREVSRQLLRADRLWLEERAEWFTELAVLLEREPGWQQRVRDAVVARRANNTRDSQRAYQHNMGVIYDDIAQLLNGRSAKQDRHLREKLKELREDFETLIAQGQKHSESPPD